MKVLGTVKWYNPTKGFGFIERNDGGKDVFLHVSELPAGVERLAEGAPMKFAIEVGRDGRLKAVDVEISTLVEEKPVAVPLAEAPSGEPVKTTIKWFNVKKCFGFVLDPDGGEDIFLHQSVAERSGFDPSELASAEGLSVLVWTEPGRQAGRLQVSFMQLAAADAAEVVSTEASAPAAEAPESAPAKPTAKPKLKFKPKGKGRVTVKRTRKGADAEGEELTKKVASAVVAAAGQETADGETAMAAAFSKAVAVKGNGKDAANVH